MKPTFRMLSAAAVATAALLAGTTAVSAAGTTGTVAADPGTDTPPPAVEDFNYPGADQILASKGILLKRGDGHIALIDCPANTADLIVVEARYLKRFCFQTTGPSGFLTMELDRVYSITGNQTDATARLTVDGTESSVKIRKGGSTSVGEPSDPQHRDHTLVELSFTR
ncbi:hypothetical protein [Kitasatospora sp. NPDC056184]|uniref:hypothetical protein n=1 Tax=Kitasatospora sp. NPDC056184 TaxID=3345738 RepID=UPI0035D77FBA